MGRFLRCFQPRAARHQESPSLTIMAPRATGPPPLRGDLSIESRADTCSRRDGPIVPLDDQIRHLGDTRTIYSDIGDSNDTLDRRSSIRIFERLETCRYGLHARIGISWIDNPVTFSSNMIQAHYSGVVFWLNDDWCVDLI